MRLRRRARRSPSNNNQTHTAPLALLFAPPTHRSILPCLPRRLWPPRSIYSVCLFVVLLAPNTLAAKEFELSAAAASWPARNRRRPTVTGRCVCSPCSMGARSTRSREQAIATTSKSGLNENNEREINVCDETQTKKQAGAASHAGSLYNWCDVDESASVVAAGPLLVAAGEGDCSSWNTTAEDMGGDSGEGAGAAAGGSGCKDAAAAESGIGAGAAIGDAGFSSCGSKCTVTLRARVTAGSCCSSNSSCSPPAEAAAALLDFMSTITSSPSSSAAASSA